MRAYGIDFVVYGWFWSSDNKPILSHGVDAYLSAQDKHGVKFALLWANHTKYTFSKSQFEALFTFWAKNYFTRNDYQKQDGRPVVYLFSAPTLSRNAAAIGMTTSDLISLANGIAKRAGIARGISFVGGVTGNDAGADYGPTSGFDGFTAYNFHSPADIALVPYRAGNFSHNYAELDVSYRNQWNWMLNRTSGRVVVPMTSGWDKRPWGGSSDSRHDDSRSTPAEFRRHLLAARDLMETQATRTERMGVVCCWNEFGEGSFIEPTKADGFKYLEQVREVFGPN